MSKDQGAVTPVQKADGERVEQVNAVIVTRPLDVGQGRTIQQRELLIDGEPLMGAAELADCLGVRVQNLQFVKGLPDPVSYPRASRMWLGSEVKALAAERQAAA